jgi:zinc protease
MLLAIALALTSATTSFDVSGIRVILRQNDANNVVAANLYLLGGSRQVTDANAGIEPILLDVSERGTLHYPKNSLRNAMSRLGSEIVVRPSADWTMIGTRSSTEVFDSTWAVFADRIMYPTLAKSEIGLVKAQYLSGIRQRRDDPDALADYLADSITYGGHPYSVSVTGNERSIQGVDSATLREYHRNHFVTSRMLLVVVGNVDRAHIERLVNQSIGKLPKGSYKWTEPPGYPNHRSGVSNGASCRPTPVISGLASSDSRHSGWRPQRPGG